MCYTLSEFLSEHITLGIRPLTKEMDFNARPIRSAQIRNLCGTTGAIGAVQAEELVLCPAEDISLSAHVLCPFLQRLKSARATAVVFSLPADGCIPIQAICFANTSDLPMFAVPGSCSLTQLSAAVTQCIQNRRYTAYNQQMAALMDLYFSDQSMDQACELIARFLHMPVSVQDAEGKTTGRSHTVDPGDMDVPSWRVALKTPQSLAGHICLYGSVAQTSLILSNGQLFEQSICLPLSLWFYRQEAEQLVAGRLKNNFLWDLATGNYPSPEEMFRQGRLLNLDLGMSCLCAVLELVQITGVASDWRHRRETILDITKIEALLTQTGASLQLNVMLANRDFQFLIYVEQPSGQSEKGMEQFLRVIESALSKQFPSHQFCCGVSGPPTKSYDFERQYLNAALALRYCDRSAKQFSSFTYQDTKVAQIIAALSGNQAVKAMARDTVSALKRYDNNSKMDLVKTLTRCISYNYNTSQTARSLHIHRQSLLYRLEKIEQLTDISLSNHRDLFLLEICTRLISNY